MLPAREQVYSLVRSHPRDDQHKKSECQGLGKDDWSTRALEHGHPWSAPLLEQTSRALRQSKKQEIYLNQQLMSGRPTTDALLSRESEIRNQPQLDCISETNTHLSFRFMSSRAWGIQSRRVCLALLHPSRTSLQSLQQSA